MTAQRKVEKAARLAAYAAALASWQKLDSRSELGSDLIDFAHHNNTPTPTEKEAP